MSQFATAVFFILLNRNVYGFPASIPPDTDRSWNVSCPSMMCTPEKCRSEPVSFNVTENFHNLGACDCHPKCSEYGTCCVNHQETCGRLLPTINGLPAYEGQKNRGVTTCEPLFVDSSLHFYLTVTSCPKSLDPMINSSVVDLCENQATRLDQTIPLIYQNKLYKNVHCLRCNGVAFEDAEVVTVNLECSNVMVEDTPQIDTIGENKMFELIAEKTCTLSYNLDSSSQIPKCYKNYIDKCTDRSLPKFEFEALDDACRSYSYYVMHIGADGRQIYFKNPHCAQCSTLELQRNLSLSCVDPTRSRFETRDLGHQVNYTKTFSFSLDMEGGIVSTFALLKRCMPQNKSTQRFINLETKKCMEKICPLGHRLFNTSMCIQDGGYSFENIHQQSHEYNFKLTLHHKKALSYNQIESELVNSEEVSKLRIKFHDCSVTNTTLCTEVMIASSHFNRDLLYLVSEKFQGVLDRLDKNMGIHHVRIISPARENTAGLYHTTSFVLSTDTALSTVTEDDVRNGNLSLLVYLPEFDSMLSIQQLNFDIKLSRNVVSRWEMLRKVAVSVKNHFNCSREGSCVSLDPPSDMYWDIMVVITRWCNIISLTALFLCLISWSAAPSVTFSTAIQISIQVSLFFVHLIFLLSSYFSFSGLACKASAALQHFFWVASFSLMNILGHLLYKSMGSKDDVSHFQRVLYLGLGWGIPLAISCTSFILHFSGYFDYAEEGICWIHGQFNVLISFSAPIGFMIAGKVVLFILITIKLRACSSEIIRGGTSRIGKLRLRFYLHLRLFAVMSSTWIYISLGSIQSLDFLSDIFFMLASLNGLFVALAATFHKPHLQMVHDRVNSAYTRSEPISVLSIPSNKEIPTSPSQ